MLSALCPMLFPCNYSFNKHSLIFDKPFTIIRLSPLQITFQAMSKNRSAKPSHDSIQAIIEIYKKDVDRTIIRQNLELTVEERLLNLKKFVEFATELRDAGRPKDFEVIAELENILDEKKKI